MMNEFQPNRVIEALAGAGKTYKLSHRYLELIQKGFEPQSILATTFSRKAAGEIRDKIIEAASNAVLNVQQRDELCEGITELHSLNDTQRKEACSLLLRQVISKIHLLQIGTIDSFFVRTAKAFGDELGFPPQWSILDELQEQQVLQEGVAAMLANQNPSEIASAIRLAKDSSLVPILDTIHSIQKSTYNLIRQTDESAWKWGVHMPTLSRDELNGAIENLSIQKTEISKHQNSIPKDVARASKGQWRSFLETGLPAAVFNGTYIFATKPIDTVVVSAIEPLVEHASAMIANRVFAKNEGTFSLMSLFNESWSNVKHEKGLYHFDDITYYLRAIKIFTDLHELAFRLDSTIDHLLIDEFQDTSIPQWEIMELLVDEIHQSDADRSLFFVGDPKQSLYGFRGGEPQLLRNLPEKLGLDEPERLPQSWRCSVPVLDAVNHIFEDAENSQLLTDNSKEGAKEWKKSFSTHVSAKPKMLGFAEIHTTEVDESRKPKLEFTVQKVAEIVRSIHSKNKDASIGILVRKNTNQQIQRIVHALRSHPTEPVHAAEHGGNPLTDSPQVTVILSALLVADHPGDNASLFHVSTSPLGSTLGLIPTWNKHDARKISASIRQRLLKEGYAKVVADFATPLFKSASKRDQFRLWQLIELAEEYSKHSTLRPYDFVEFVKNKQIADPATSKVQVMTVHASKGLGFDAVVVCDLNEPLWKNPDVLTLHESKCLPPYRVSMRENAKFNAIIPMQEEMWEECKSEQVQEALSLLYVAMTRAKHALYLVIPPRPKNEAAKTYRKPTSKVVDRFIREALELPEHLEPDSVVWSSEFNSDDWHSDVVEQVVDDISLDSKDLEWGELKSNHRGIATSSPSSLEGGGKTKIGERYLSGTNTAFDWGTVIHSWFEEIEWLDEYPTIDHLLKTAPSEEARRLGSETLHSLATNFCEQLDCKKLQQLLTKPDGNVTVFQEQAFMLRVAKGTSFADVTMKDPTDIQGTIDRLVVHYDNNDKPIRAEVIDWKSDTFPLDELESKVLHYAPQLASYRLAAAKLLGLELEDVSAHLAFVAEGHMKEITEEASITTP